MEIKKKKLFQGYSKFEKRDFLFIYALIAIPVLNFLVFWVYVNFSSITMAFLNTKGEFTWMNFKTVYNAFLTKDMYGISLKDSMTRSFTLWICGELICFPISIITTYVLAKKILGHYAFRICYLIPSLMGAIIWTSLVRFMFSYNGPVTDLLIKLNVELPKSAIRNGLFGAKETAFKALLSVRILMGLVGQNAVMTGAFSRVPDELFESAKLDGAGFWTECFKIAIPCIWSTLSTLLTFALCSIFVCDYNVYLYTDGTGGPSGSMSTIGFQIYNLTYRLSQGNSDNYGYPAALGLILTVFTLPIVLIGRRILDKIQENVEV
jgi:multiple sugar transport system permease protein/raffinose/stachyose/melibiose transport system permease protein